MNSSHGNNYESTKGDCSGNGWEGNKRRWLKQKDGID